MAFPSRFAHQFGFSSQFRAPPLPPPLERGFTEGMDETLAPCTVLGM